MPGCRRGDSIAPLLEQLSAEDRRGVIHDTAAAVYDLGAGVTA